VEEDLAAKVTQAHQLHLEAEAAAERLEMVQLADRVLVVMEV
jgi:hypothetical protein